MSAPRATVAGRRPIQLPRQTFPFSSPTPTPRHNNDINTAFTDVDESENDIHATIGTWIHRLHEFAHRQAAAGAAAAAALASVNSFGDGTLATLSSVRPRVYSTTSATAAATSSAPSATGVTLLTSINQNDEKVNEARADENVVDSLLPSAFALRVLACTDDFTALDARVDADEGYFGDVAEVEACIMEHLREWRKYIDAERNNSNGYKNGSNNGSSNSNRSSGINSPRVSGLYSGTQSQATRLSGAFNANSNDKNTIASDNRNNSNNSIINTMLAGSGGSQRVQADLDNVRQATDVMAELHSTLAVLEDEHRGLQRQYIIEKTPFAELDILCGRLEELEREEEATQDETFASAVVGRTGSTTSADVQVPLSKRQRRKSHRDAGRGKLLKEDTDAQQQELPQERETIRASLTACHHLADQLRARVAGVAERLTDELLWMRAEVDRHDWSTVRTATALTKMEPVSVVLSVGSGGGNGGEGRTTATAVRNSVLSQAQGNNDDGKNNEVSYGREDALHEATSSSSSSSSSSANFSHTAERDSNRRDSFLLRVQVPIFVSNIAPPLPTMPSEGPTRLSDSSTPSSSRPSRHTTGGTESSYLNSTMTQAMIVGQGGVARRQPGNSIAFSSTALAAAATMPKTATVSVVATPARYALMQFFEACRDFLARMLTRLVQLRARRSAEAEQLQLEQQTLDTYDPAAGEVTLRLQAVSRYVAQLDSDVNDVHAAHQALHERVKLPLDASLQTYERFRTQLLEVLKQRLEQKEEEAAALQVLQAGTKDGYEQEAQTQNTEAQLDRVNSTQFEKDEEGQVHDQQQQERQQEQRRLSTASLSQEGACRTTQSPEQALAVAASSSILPPQRVEHEVPRASAEFIDMLNTLLKSQREAAAAAAVAVPAPSLTNAEEEVCVFGPASFVGGSDEVTVIGMANDADALAKMEDDMEGEALVKAATEREMTTAPFRAAKTAEDAAQEAPAASSFSEHSVCGRRPREENDDCSKTDEAKVNYMQTANIAEGALESHKKTSEAERRVGTVPDDTFSGSAEDGEDEEDSDVGVDENGLMYLGHRQQQCRGYTERKRYGLSSEGGFSGGLRAFFAAVARRVMDFSGSDDDDDDAVNTGRGGRAAVAGQQRKRARYE